MQAVKTQTMAGRRVLPGFEDVYEELFGDSESNVNSDTSTDVSEEEEVGHRPAFEEAFRVQWNEGGVAPVLPNFTGELTNFYLYHLYLP